MGVWLRDMIGIGHNIRYRHLTPPKNAMLNLLHHCNKHMLRPFHVHDTMAPYDRAFFLWMFIPKQNPKDGYNQDPTQTIPITQHESWYESMNYTVLPRVNKNPKQVDNLTSPFPFVSLRHNVIIESTTPMWILKMCWKHYQPCYMLNWHCKLVFKRSP
jgi:hypothetical protein